MTANIPNPDLPRFLRDPASYPHRPEQVELIETHISWVFLAGEYVYKLKKPVRFEFLDFSTSAAREFACREELRLNRRLAPGIYLDVLPVAADEAGQFSIGGAGEPLDWLVHMRRLPTDQSLDALHARGMLRPEQMERIAEVLAEFYRGLPAEPLTAEQYCDRTLAHVRGNRDDLLAATSQLSENRVKRVHAAQLQALAWQGEMFAQRVRDGRIVEGHGDLRPEHICLTEPPAIFDCIEFSADFRRLDVADELSFLAAECDFLGADWVGSCLWQKYSQLTGDRPPPLLLAFYKSYRACVRAKVAALRAQQLSDVARQTAIAEADRHLQLADEYLRGTQQPLVLLVGGLSGTGKTTLARALAETLGADLLRTDVIRQELWGDAAQPAAVAEGIYTAEARQRIYDELFARAARLHREQIPVILDGTFAHSEQLFAAQALVSDSRHFLAIECVCPPEVALARIRHRLATSHDASQADPAVYEQQRNQRQPWPAALPQRQIDTQQAIAVQVAQVLAALSLSPCAIVPIEQKPCGSGQGTVS